MRALFLFLILFSASPSFAQKVQLAIDMLYQKFPQEKVVLSFSKNEYVAGETIYFKAYVLTSYEPSEVSTNLYVELYDINKKVIRQHIIPLLKGSGEGSFILPASLEENIYYIRAYTKYMLNYDEAFQYIRPINIYNPASPKKIQHKQVQWTAAALTEGGTLLNDVATTLAVRLFSEGRLPESWKGSLLEKGTNSLIGHVDVFNNEVGKVSFAPKAGREYIISITDNNGTTKIIDVPKWSTSGASLVVKNNNDRIQYALHFKNNPSNGTGYKLVGTMHDQVMFVATIKKSAGVVEGSIDISTLPSGVLRLTLFDEKESPLNERLCFLHQQIKTVTPELSVDTISFSAKGRNHWQVVLDSSSWPTYAVQVNDAAYPIQNRFLSDVYLSSDFSTPIKNSSWYLQEVNETKKEALDALLITEKWMRFSWNDILNNRFPVLQFHPDHYLSYTATVRKGKTLQPLRDVNLLLKGRDSSIQFLQVKTDSLGGFAMHNLVFTDTLKVYYQANSRKTFDRDITISFELLNKFHPYKKMFPSSDFETGARSKGDTLPLYVKWTVAQKNNEKLIGEKEKLMEEVIVRARAKTATEALDRKLSSGLFSSPNEMIFDFINEEQTSAQGYTNILDWLEGRVAGFSTTLRDGVVTPILRGDLAQVFLDEMLVEADVLNGLSTSDIAMVKVIRGIFIGSRGGNGAIAIYTRRGGLNERSSSSSLPNNILIGYQMHPPLFSPDYSNDGVQAITDQREILFRQSLLYPDATLKVPLVFYNNDRAKQFRLLITGFTSKGRLVYLERIIQ